MPEEGHTAGRSVSRRRFITVGVASGGALLLGGAASAASGAFASNRQAHTARLNYHNQVGVVDDKILYTLAAYDLALQKGYFAKRGLYLKTVTSASGAELIREALTDLHFAVTASTDSLVAYASDPASVRIISGIYDAASLQYIVGPKSPIRTVADLRGKKIATSTPTALSTYFATLAVKKAGLVPGKDVTIDYIGAPPACFAALQHGLVDCAWTLPPFSTAAILDKQARLLFAAKQYQPHWFDNCIVGDAQFIKSHPDVARAFLAAIGEATSFIRARPAEAGRQWAHIASTPVTATVKAFSENRANFSLSFSRQFLEAAASADAVTGTAKKIPDLPGIADPSYLPAGYRYIG